MKRAPAKHAAPSRLVVLKEASAKLAPSRLLPQKQEPEANGSYEPIDPLIDPLFIDPPIAEPAWEVGQALPHRNWAGTALATLLVAAVVVFAVVKMTGHSTSPAHKQATTPTKPVSRYHGPDHLTVLAVRAAPTPFVAVLGSMGGKAPVAVDVPIKLVLTLPGHGTGTVGDAVMESGSLLRASIGNMLGVWPEHFAAGNMSSLASDVDNIGGLHLNLLSSMKLGGQDVGPGAATLTGIQAVDYLVNSPDVERSIRWEEVLGALFRAGWQPSSFADSDAPKAVAKAVAAADGATVQELPTTPSGGGLLKPDKGGISRMLSGRLGITPPHTVSVVVLNGSGAPGVGESVAGRLIPGGFQVAASSNAEKFGLKVTHIYAENKAALPKAKKARKLLGVGDVVLGGGPTGLADITIVVGKDFKA